MIQQNHYFIFYSKIDNQKKNRNLFKIIFYRDEKG